MNSKCIDDEPKGTPSSEPTNFATWMGVTLAGYALGIAVLVGSLGLALGLPARKLLVPSAVLVGSGFVFSPLLYWARLARDRPRTCAVRFGIAQLLYVPVLMLAIWFGAVWLRILSISEVLRDYLPFVLPFSVFGSIVAYVATRQVLDASALTRSNNKPATKFGADKERT